MTDAAQADLAGGIDAVMEVVEVMGGEALPETCEPDDLGAVEGYDHHLQDLTTGCGYKARFGLPYHREDGEPGVVVACVIDDWAARWPALAG